MGDNLLTRLTEIGASERMKEILDHNDHAALKDILMAGSGTLLVESAVERCAVDQYTLQ